MTGIQDKLNVLTEEQVATLYKEVFSGVNGQLVLEDLRNRCYSYVSTVGSPDSVHANEVIYKEGMRSVILHIETNLKYVPLERKE